MSKLDEFKEFVKNNPSLVNYVNDNSMTWQKFYEMYDMFGSSNEVWNKYTKKNMDIKKDDKISLGDFFSFFKNIDLDNFQEGIQNVQRVVEMIGDISVGDSKKTDYKPRPLYKHFDD